MRKLLRDGIAKASTTQMISRQENRIGWRISSDLNAHLSPLALFYPKGRSKLLGLTLKDYIMVAYLLDAVGSPDSIPVQKPAELELPGGPVKITNDFFRAAQRYTISECSLLQVIGPEAVAVLKSQFQLDAD
jgi:hypothetical protein